MRILAFDSGVGGLSVLAPIFKQVPNVSVHYLGDIANLPYGTKSPERLRSLTMKNLRWLVSSLDPKARPGDLCLVACNTSSAEALEVAQKELNPTIPVIGMIEASCDLAIAQKTPSIAVLATPATVKSGAYEKALRARGFTGKIQQIPCPLFVPFVEEGVLDGPAIEWVVDRYMGGKISDGEAIILGCTHYPYLLPLLKKKFPRSHFTQAGDALVQMTRLFHNEEKRAQSAQLKITVTDSNASREQISFFLKQLGISEISWSIETIAPL